MSQKQPINLTSVERPEKESVPKIEDSYTYNGEGLRVSQTIKGTTSYFAWDPTEGLPLLLSDGTNSYIYGPGGVPVEQLTGETPAYLHHDQQGSTRLLTGSAGTVTGKCTYSAYGTPTCEGTTTTPLGYDGQYTSSDTGLVYLRARNYDPATGQFLSVDPVVPITRAPYNYANDNPLTYGDPSGLSVLGDLESAGETVLHVGLDVAAVPPYAVYYGSYEVARGINGLGEEFGLPGEVVSHMANLPLAALQGLGLAGDAAIDEAKNLTLGGESVCDEGTRGYINPLHSFLPPSLQGPQIYLPGIHPNGSVDFEW